MIGSVMVGADAIAVPRPFAGYRRFYQDWARLLFDRDNGSHPTEPSDVQGKPEPLPRP